ncbi:MAG: NAD(P)/FAD-dependent oxidoreductase [Defluviitaleaceae bacterium]|nr:NAD(P)/FAD-dependent oxidoreductase [Defluviitaleaceae bacterium]
MMDALIIGGGPAGATAAVYIARAGFKATIIYKDYGALEKAERVDNFYGFTKISGKSLVEKGLRQARQAGAKTVRGEVVGISKGEKIIVKTTSTAYESKTVLLAVGATRRTPNIPGLGDYEGRGISYCAICDGFFYRGKNVAVLGNGAYALHEVEDLLPLVSSVTLLTNGKEPTVNFPDSVEIRTEKIREIIGVEKSQLLSKTPAKILDGVIFETSEKLQVSGLFVAEGIAGSSELARKIGAALDSQNSVKIDNEQCTTVQGLWAAGDCTGGLKQIVKAAHEGAQAGISIINFLRGNF